MLHPGCEDAQLYAAITAWSNLLVAAHKAARGKRRKLAAATFEADFADHLIALRDDLRAKVYTPGVYTSFIIQDPKVRKISAAPFRDRIAHHALCNIIEPIFDARFIPHSYANRIGKGTHAAVDRLQQFARQYRYVLRCDIRQFFPAIDHAIMHDVLADVIHDADTLWLCDQILASGQDVLRDEYDMVYFPGDDLFAANRCRGLPIGNLTSQFWANCYLNPFDWFVTRELRCPAYLRYVDDFALFSDSKRELWRWKQAIIQRLAQFRLTIHESVAQVVPVTQGIPWLGFVVYPGFRRVKGRKVRQYSRRLQARIEQYVDGEITLDELTASAQGWIAHVSSADPTGGLRRGMFARHPIPRQET
ncbi:MAG: RNA-directed DNA polymerase [Chloroflexi bacterium]|nr:RNA-directed DNA polymerase [Chloroflexota bacterium]